VSIGKLFFGGVIPGAPPDRAFHPLHRPPLRNQSAYGPPLPPEERFTWDQKVRSLKGVILRSWSSFWSWGLFTWGWPRPRSRCHRTGGLTPVRRRPPEAQPRNAEEKCSSWESASNAMVCWIMIGAVLTPGRSPLPGWGVVLRPDHRPATEPLGNPVRMQVMFFILGCVLDPAGIILITIPIFIPIVRALGFDPLWFGILFVMNMEMAYLTPLRVQPLRHARGGPGRYHHGRYLPGGLALRGTAGPGVDPGY